MNSGNPSAAQSVFRSRFRSDCWVCRRLGGRRRWYQPVHPLLSPSAPGGTASVASFWMSTLPDETMTVRQKRSLTVQKYCRRCTLLLSYVVLIQESSLPVMRVIRSTSLPTTNLHLLCKGRGDTNATSGSEVEALTAKQTKPAVLELYYAEATEWIFVLSLRKGGASGLAQPFCKPRSIWHWNEIGRPR